MEARAKAEAARDGVPYQKTAAFRRLQTQCYRAIERDGFRDIEFEDPRTQEPGDVLRGLNTAQILALAGPAHRTGTIVGDEAANTRRAQTARMRMDAQEEWFDLIRSRIPEYSRIWPKSPWRAKALGMYAAGQRFDDIARALRLPRDKVKNAICNALRRIRKDTAAGLYGRPL